MHVVFVEPSFPNNQREFLRGLLSTGARVTAISERPIEAIPEGLRRSLFHYERVRSVVDESALQHAVERASARARVDRLEATIEAHVMAAAHVREKLSIYGTTSQTAWLCRDKPAMKQVARDKGIACAQSDRVQNPEQAAAFAERIGYPLILKPLDGAGASGTHKVTNRQELDGAIDKLGVAGGRAVAIEEFMDGHEGFYDTVTVDGQPVLDFVSHYFPNVLEAMRTRWISPQILVTNRIESSDYQELRAFGKKVISALGIWTSATHMEWFFGPKGLKFSEIGCRPPGVGLWDLYCAANEFDLFAAWAQAIVHGHVAVQPNRRFAAGMIALRPDKDGTIDRYEGVDWLQRELHPWIIDSHFPAPGTATQGVEAGYMANAWVRMKHPDFDELKRLLDQVGERVKVKAR